MIKGITVVSSLILLARPQAATIPFGFVCDNALAKILPPVVSTTPSCSPLSMGLAS